MSNLRWWAIFICIVGAPLAISLRFLVGYFHLYCWRYTEQNQSAGLFFICGAFTILFLIGFAITPLLG